MTKMICRAECPICGSEFKFSLDEPKEIGLALALMDMIKHPEQKTCSCNEIIKLIKMEDRKNVE